MAGRRRRAKIHTHRAPQVSAGRVRADINITPLVDVVLVLLIIFMVVTPMLHRGVPIDLPKTAFHNRHQDSGVQLVVSVRADGIYVDSDKLEGRQLTERLQRELTSPSRPIHIRADRSLPYGAVRHVLELVHAAGGSTVGMGTQEEERKE